MGAVGGVAILGGNFEAATFPEDKVVQRSLTAGTQESSAIDAVILDALPLGAPGQLDSHAFLWKGHSHNGSPHTIDWKAFVNVTADDGTGSLWTLQTRIDGAPYTDILTVDDNGLLTVSGATFTMDQLIIDSDNTEAVLIRKDGDAGDVFIVDTVNDVVRMGSNDTFLTFGASSDARLERFGPRDIGMREPGVGGVALGAGGENTFRIYARDDVAGSAARFLELTGDGPTAVVKANRFAGGGQFDLFIDVTVGRIAFFNENVQRWNIQGSVTADFEFAPFITNRYDLGSASFAVRNLYTNGVLIGQDKTSAYDAITIDGTDLAAPGQQDSGAIILTGLSNDGSPHDIDWKQFVDVTANDGTGSIFTIQARIDGASFVDEFTITATTSPTLVSIGPGSTGGALGFGPPASAAQAGTVRFQFTDDIRYRNEGDDGDFIALSFGESSKMILGEAGIPFIEVPAQFIVNNEMSINVDDTGAFAIRSTSFTLFQADTVNFDIELLQNVARSAAVVDRFKILGSNLLVNSTVGFSGAMLLEGQAREAGGSLHDATWRMYVEPLTSTGFDGQSVFKITAEIDTGGPTTVFTLSDTGDLIVPGSFTIDGLIIDVSSPEAFLVRKDGDTGDVFVIDTDDSEVEIFGTLLVDVSSDTAFRVNAGASNIFTVDTDNGGQVTVTGALHLPQDFMDFGALPANTGTFRLSNVDSINIRNAANNADLNVISFNTSNQMDFGDAAMPQIFVKTRADFEDRVLIMTGGPTSGGALLVGSDFNVDTTNKIVAIGASSFLTTGGTPALSGTVRMSYADSITFRNTADDGDLSIISFDDSNQMLFGEAGIPRMDINAGRLITNRIRITHTNAAAFEVNNDSNLILFRVDTSAGDLFVGQSFAPSRVVLTQPDLTGAGFEDSPSVIYEGKSFDSTPHTQQFITFVDMETNAGAGQWTLRSRFDGGGNVNLVFVTDEGRFAIAQPEQVSIGSQSFIDNVQVNITGNFIDDYGGGPTTTHKLKIQGSQTGDAGRTNRQTTVDIDAAIITQNNSEVINEVGAMFIDEPAITIGTDTINIGYTLKVNNAPTEGTENYGLLVVNSAATATLTALVRIGKSGLQTGIKLLVGGSVGFDNLAANTQMRLTGIYTSDGSVNSASLLHVHTTLLPEDGTTDHITGAFFEATLRTQVAADENVANISQVRIDEPNIQDNLTGTGEITNAQSLLITGAPTEGESNYAQRILGGDLQVAASSAFLFRNNGNSGDLTALSNAPTDVLEIGGVGAGEWERVNIYSLGSIDLRPTDDVTVFSDVANPFQVRSLTPNEELFRVSRTQVRAVGQLVSVANLADHLAETQMQTTFVDVATSAGSSVTAASLIPAGSFLIGITVRVISNVGGPASFDVGDGIDVDRWGASIAAGIGTTTDITDFTSGAVTTFPAANDVVLTSTGVDFTAGTVRITVHYTTLQTSAA